MHSNLRLGLACVLFASIHGLVMAQPKTIQRLDGSTLTPVEIERHIARLMAPARVTGLGVAILNDNRIAYRKAFGWCRKEEKLPLTENSVMYGASFTKSVFSTLVMQLVTEGWLGLDKPLAQYLPQPLPTYEKYAE